ncbi:nucleotidyltransferase family protein [Dyadobacter aurulentus]|uniref:nucleotidyltransferase family protein n=1 Tax=Dyadobacter sp. UC 10 TaxID=2605428 RepID=UPI001788E5B2|nr:nucleotidyltransferase family protein [Dyadobacter sp. UC 10]
MWEQQVVMDELDYSCFRLIPLFYRGNSECGIATVHDKRLKIVYKYWWLKNQHLSNQLNVIHRTFSAAGIESVVIKGASLKTYYDLGELRPMADFDLLVRPSDLNRAMKIIHAGNFKVVDKIASYFEKKRNVYQYFNHAVSCIHTNNDTQLDLHWRIGSHCSYSFTSNLWNHLDDYPLIPNAKKPKLAYEICMLLIHAIESENRDNLNWIIDAAMINKVANQAYWKEARQLAVAEKKESLFDYGCSILVSLGIEAPDPGVVMRPLGAMRTGPAERKVLDVKTIARHRFHNHRLFVNSMFPNANRFAKTFEFGKSVYYKYILSKNGYFME